MNISENSDQHPQDFLYRLLTAAILIVLFIFIVLSIMNSTGAFDRNDSETTAVITALNDDVPPEDNPALAVGENIAETAAPETTVPPVTVAPELVDAYNPGNADTAYAFTSPMASLYPNTVLGVTDDAGKEYIAKIIFLGDSTSYGLIPYQMLPGGRETTQVWTPKSGTLALSQIGLATINYPQLDDEILISEAVELSHPEIMVITLGVNGVSFMKEEFFKSEYTKLIESIQEISPSTKIILQSIFPVAKSYKHQDQINNDRIEAANLWILDVANECGVKYLDTASALAGDDGFLPEALQNGDGMHLNETGFKIELDYIRTHAYK